MLVNGVPSFQRQTNRANTRGMSIPDRCVDRLLFRAAHVRAASLIVMPAMALPFNARA